MLTRLLNINRSNPQSFFLFGPRGTGKTSWVVANFPDALYIDLLKHRDYLELMNHPGKLETWILGTNADWIIIDEVQKIPAILDEVHRLIERYKKSFILTGSSSRKLKRGGANLLAGRALTYHMHPLTALEIGKTFDLNKAVRWGLLPLSYLGTDPRAFLASYVVTYLQEEVMQEGLVRQIGAFSRFMEIASYSQGCTLNLLNIAREVGVSHKIVTGYFDILEDLLLAFRLPCFSKHSKRKLTQHPKFYYVDVGLYQQLRPRGILDTPEEIGGAAFETLFVQNLRAIIEYCKLDLKIYYWRTASLVEVDFVVYGGDGFFAFEIKSKPHIHHRDLAGLKTFYSDYPQARCYLIYMGEHTEKHGQLTAIPIKEALISLKDILTSDY